jgi:hypothetical protein
MYFYNQQFLDWRNELDEFDGQLNTDPFNAYIKFNDLYNDRLPAFLQKYGIEGLGLHLWEDGFTKGDAVNEEIKVAADTLGVPGDYDEDLEEWDFQDFYTFLDRQFIVYIEEDVQKLIEEYQAWCKEQLTEREK